MPSRDSRLPEMKRKRLLRRLNVGSFGSTWQIEDFSCDHVLIPSDIPGHSKQSSTDVEQSTMFRNKQKLTSGNIGIGSKSAEFVGSFSIVTLTHSFTEHANIVASPP